MKTGWLAGSVALIPAAATAHLASSGLGPFYDGALHFALSADQWLSVLAVTLLVGLGGPRHGRMAVLLLPAAWTAGGLAAVWASVPGPPDTVPALLLLAVGLLVALDLPGPARFAAVLALVVGGVNGVVGGLDAAAGGLGMVGLLGTSATVLVCAALGSAAFVVVGRRADWPRIVLRVMGSWLAAVGLLMSGWSIRQGW